MKPVTKIKYDPWFEANAFDLDGRLKKHMRHASNLTRFGNPDYANKKFERTGYQKEQAKTYAKRFSGDGAFHYPPIDEENAR